MPATQQYTDIFNTPVGYLGIQISGRELSGIEFLGKQTPATNAKNVDSRDTATEHSKRLIREALNNYFHDPRSCRQPTTLLQGTPFQLRVWKALSSINPGHTRTYGDIAAELKSSARAVGNACRQNPVPIFIPCHRVVARSGRGGFMGQTTGEAMQIKEWLLAHEQNFTTAR